MKIITDLILLSREHRPVVLAAGFFDGLHRGHRCVIDKSVSEARRIGGVAWVLTFDTHPMRILRPGSAPLMLTSNRHKLKLLEKMHIDGCLLMPFTRLLAGLNPEAFVALLSSAVPTLTRIFVGKNWRFGHREEGDAKMLVKLAQKLFIKVTVVKPVLMSGRIISSTRIRKEVAKGNLADAEGMLGRPFSILGTVVKGRAVGRKIGFPTANLKTFNEVLPPFGVYAVHAVIGKRVLDGVVNIGIRPTFGGSNRRKSTIEVHLFKYRGDLYGREVEIFFIRKLRDERRFKSVNDLKKQIERDKRSASKILRKRR
ncbi:MAG: bifunctional riboflavin kinase/FAD synthetase [Kiritimatiellae bacterium]|nr:bifunctional riboflavin kinase/FAD synthetase [Kiritimatiellia bacterium]MDD5519336.1 bifunctional riboflavin kinase/FAD synthetase [Kiritimatiellia bacterium]